MTLILDYAWVHPAPALIKTAGYDGVMRYLSPDPTKNLSPAETIALHAAGLSIGLVWESTASRAGEGQTAGIADADAAETQAHILGYPIALPIFYAVDYDADPQAVQAYFNGVRVASHHPIGVYGSLRVVEAIHAAGGVPYMWQSVAWSGGVVSQQAHLYQRLTPTRAPIPDSDENTVLRPFPLWTDQPVPPKPPTPPAPFTRKANPMYLLKAANSPAVYVTDFFTKRHICAGELGDLEKIVGKVQTVSQATITAIPTQPGTPA